MEIEGYKSKFKLESQEAAEEEIEETREEPIDIRNVEQTAKKFRKIMVSIVLIVSGTFAGISLVGVLGGDVLTKTLPLLLLVVFLVFLVPHLLKDVGKASTLGVPSGVVRGIITLVLCLCVVVFIVVGDNAIPIHLIMIFSVVLTYYGFKPSDVLPKKYNVIIPEDFGKISRFPPINKAIDVVVEKLEGVKKLLENVKLIGKKFFDSVDQQTTRIRLEVDARLDHLSKLSDRYKNETSSVAEQVGIIGMMGTLVFISASYFNQNPNDFSLNLILGPILGIISVISGLDLSVAVFKKAKAKFNNTIDELENIVNYTRGAFTKNMDETIKGLGVAIENIKVSKDKNIMSFLPVHLIGIVSLIFMVVFGSILLVEPKGPLSTFCLVVMESVVGFYFVMKK